MIERMFFLMKKYTTPVISELIDLEDVLESSESDNLDGTIGKEEGYDKEDNYGRSLLAD